MNRKTSASDESGKHPSREEARAMLERYLRERGLRLTRQRETILDVFLSKPRHISAEDLYKLALEKDTRLGAATVYRTLKLLTQCGLADERQFQGGSTRYEPADAEHHDHCICTGCGKIVEFENPVIEQLQEEAARRLGFLLTHHRMELYGLCSGCQARDSKRRRTSRGRS